MTTKEFEIDHLAAHLIDLALLVFPGVYSAADDMDDSISEVYEEPSTIEGLEWFQAFSSNDIIPFVTIRLLGVDSFSTSEA
jgi:hypothetical protein